MSGVLTGVAVVTAGAGAFAFGGTVGKAFCHTVDRSVEFAWQWWLTAAILCVGVAFLSYRWCFLVIDMAS